MSRLFFLVFFVKVENRGLPDDPTSILLSGIMFLFFDMILDICLEVKRNDAYHIQKLQDASSGIGLECF